MKEKFLMIIMSILVTSIVLFLSVIAWYKRPLIMIIGTIICILEYKCDKLGTPPSAFIISSYTLFALCCAFL